MSLSLYTDTTLNARFKKVANHKMPSKRPATTPHQIGIWRGGLDVLMRTHTETDPISAAVNLPESL